MQQDKKIKIKSAKNKSIIKKNQTDYKLELIWMVVTVYTMPNSSWWSVLKNERPMLWFRASVNQDPFSLKNHV